MTFEFELALGLDGTSGLSGVRDDDGAELVRRDEEFEVGVSAGSSEIVVCSVRDLV